MSQNPDRDRIQVHATTDDMIVKASELVAASGAVSLEIAYEATNRELADVDPTPEDTIRWIATAAYANPDREYVGSAVAEPGESHARALGYALTRLIQALGVNTTVVDLQGDEEPAW